MSFLTDIVTSKEKEPEKVKKYNLQFKEDDKIIYINCCGKGFAILESTIEDIRGSKLFRLLTVEDLLERDKNGALFLDRPVESFEQIINTIRTKKNYLKNETPGLLKELKFYGLNDSFKKLKFDIEEDSEEDSEKISGNIDLKYKSNTDNNGIFYYIATEAKKKPWKNPMDSGFISVSSFQNDSIGTGTISTFFSEVSKATSDLWLSCSKPAAFVIDLKANKAKVNMIVYKHFLQNCCYPKSWTFEGSNDNSKWEVLERFDQQHFTTSGQVCNFPIKSKKFYRYFRIMNQTMNSSNWNFGISAFEMYGILIYK